MLGESTSQQMPLQWSSPLLRFPSTIDIKGEISIHTKYSCTFVPFPIEASQEDPRLKNGAALVPLGPICTNGPRTPSAVESGSLLVLSGSVSLIQGDLPPEWIRALRTFTPALRKLEGDGQVEERDPWKHIFQFRLSELRVNRHVNCAHRQGL